MKANVNLSKTVTKLYDALVVVSVARELLAKGTVKWSKKNWIAGRYKDGSPVAFGKGGASRAGREAVRLGGFGKCSMCAVGALNAAEGIVMARRGQGINSDPAHFAERELEGLVPYSLHDVPAFNDRKDTRLRDVLALFDRGIQKLQADLNKAMKAS